MNLEKIESAELIDLTVMEMNSTEGGTWIYDIAYAIGSALREGRSHEFTYGSD